MSDKDNKGDRGQKPPERKENEATKRMREVIVRHEDEPPTTGKRSIHQRRPAPIVPQRNEEPADETPDETGRKESSNP